MCWIDVLILSMEMHGALFQINLTKSNHTMPSRWLGGKVRDAFTLYLGCTLIAQLGVDQVASSPAIKERRASGKAGFERATQAGLP